MDNSCSSACPEVGAEVEESNGIHGAGEDGLLGIQIPLTVMIDEVEDAQESTEEYEPSDDEPESDGESNGSKASEQEENFDIPYNELRFLGKNALISLLLDSEAIASKVPEGGDLVNHYFLLDDSEHFHNGRRKIGRINFRIDDVAGWAYHTVKRHHYQLQNGEYRFMEVPAKRFPDLHKRKDIMVLKKHYAFIKGKIKRRITYIEKCPEGVRPLQDTVILVEYLKDFSPAVPVVAKEQYSEENISEDVILDTTQDVYKEIILAGEDVPQCNLRFSQIHSPSQEADFILESEVTEDVKPAIFGNIHVKNGVSNNGHFLEKNVLIELLLTAETNIEEIPPGHKENKYFVIINEDNRKRTRAGQRRVYVDDCGAWKAVSMKKHCYSYIDGSYVFIEYVNGHYKVSDFLLKNRNIPFVEKSKVLSLRKVYAALKRDENYKRRITWIEEFADNVAVKQKNIALVEYIGKYPRDAAPHGNQKTPGAQSYVRTPARLMEELREKVATKTPKEIVAEYPEIRFTAREMKQMENLRYRSNLRICAGSAKDNDHIQDLTQLVSMVHGHPFLQQAIYTKNKSPLVIAHTTQQLNTYRSHCTDKSGMDRCAGIDCTVSIGPLRLTILVYSSPNLLSRKTLLPAIMMGPILFHFDTLWETYASFFNHIVAKLSSAEDTSVDSVSVACRSDEELPVMKALHHCFPKAKISLCSAHLKNALKQFLRTETQSTPQFVETIADEIFSELMNCVDEYDFDVKVSKLQSEYDSTIPQFSHYFGNLAENIKNNMWSPDQGQCSSLQWTTSTCEALNNLMMMSKNWEKLKVHEVVLQVHNIIKLQEENEVKALYNEGSFVLAQHGKRYQVTKEEWIARSAKEKNRLTEKMRKYKLALPKGEKRKMETEDRGTWEKRPSRYSVKN